MAVCSAYIVHVGVDKRNLCQMLDLNIDTHRNTLLKYSLVLKAIKEQFLSKNITFNCWKTNIHYSDMAQNLIIMNTHLKDAENIGQGQQVKVPAESVHREGLYKIWRLIFFFFFFFWFGFYGPFKNISLISSRSFIEGGRKPENPEKNHLTIRKQNLAFPHMTRARLEPQRWET